MPTMNPKTCMNGECVSREYRCRLDPPRRRRPLVLPRARARDGRRHRLRRHPAAGRARLVGSQDRRHRLDRADARAARRGHRGARALGLPRHPPRPARLAVRRAAAAAEIASGPRTDPRARRPRARAGRDPEPRPQGRPGRGPPRPARRGPLRRPAVCAPPGPRRLRAARGDRRSRRRAGGGTAHRGRAGGEAGGGPALPDAARPARRRVRRLPRPCRAGPRGAVGAT